MINKLFKMIDDLNLDEKLSTFKDYALGEILENAYNKANKNKKIATKFFIQTMKSRYNFTDETIDKLYKRYFYNKLIFEVAISEDATIKDDVFYIYDEKEVYKTELKGYIPFYEGYKKIKKLYVAGGVNEYAQALKYLKISC